MESKNKIVDVKNLSFSYGKEQVLQDVSFSIEERDFIGIIGPNGGGKSTLVKILLGILPSKKGTVSIFGGAPLSDPHKIAYLPQNLDFDSQIPVTVKEVVLMGCLGHTITSFFSASDKARANRAMKLMNVYEFKDKFFSSLSGGQKQRVLIARAITCRPKLLILDEPSAGIDQHHEQILYRLLKELNKEMAIMVVSHEYHFVSSHVDYVFCVNKTVHSHRPHTITIDEFQKMISSKYKFIEHGHKVYEE